MNFISLNFAAFFLISFLGYWFLVPKRWQRLFLSLCSLVFYLSCNGKFVPVFVFMIILIYLAGLLIIKSEKHKATILAIVLTGLIVHLCFYKYFDLLSVIMRNGSFLNRGFSGIMMPLGISYMTFKLIHYIVEVYRGNIKDSSFVDFGLYVIFFPTFPAGPVERFQRFQMDTREIAISNIDIAGINYGLFRILCGIFRKVVIADAIRRFVTPVISSPQLYSPGILLLTTYGIAIQIYMDFAGYSDIAIGSARMFGYRIMENFNKPFLKSNIALFWRNWHISVYSWIRDYFFFPIFGYRASNFKLYLGILCSMIIFNLWHRGTLNFLILGLYHGFGLIIWQAFQVFKKKQPWIGQLVNKKYLTLVSILLTFNFVSAGFIFFVADLDKSVFIIQRILFLK